MATLVLNMCVCVCVSPLCKSSRRWGASLTDKPHGYSLLHLAAGVGSLASVTFLLECGADPNGELGECGMVCRYAWVQSLLLVAAVPREGAFNHSACLASPVRMFQALSSPSPALTSPAAVAALSWTPPCLLVAERDNREGVTPLHSAALGACVRCVKALLEAGADPGLEDSEGKLAADLVAPQDAAQLAELLAAKPSGMAKAGAKKAGWQPSPSKSAQQQFIDLPQVSWVDVVCAAVSVRFAHFRAHSLL